MNRTPTASRVSALLAAVAGIALLSASAHAQRFENEVAVFAALDKVTARISKLEIPLNQSQTFGSLKVTPRVCYSRPPDEPPKTSTFVEMEETMLDGQQKRLFSGWMFAESPGLNAVEHPIFDIWLTGCEKPISGRAAARGDGRTGPPAEDAETTRRRVRR